MIIRKGIDKDIDAVATIYEKIHIAEENGIATIGWKRGVYPEKETALNALCRDDLFVIEENNRIVGSAILNKIQVDVYAKADWQYKANSSEVMVMHTLAVDPEMKHRGYGKSLIRFYEDYALKNNCPYLRMDTIDINFVARRLYQSMGYKEIGIMPCVFNGLEGTNLVLLEKCLKA